MRKESTVKQNVQMCPGWTMIVLGCGNLPSKIAVYRVCLAMAHHSLACWDLTSTFNFSISTSVEPRFGWTEACQALPAPPTSLQTPVLMWCNLSLFLGLWPGGETSLRAFDAAPDSILWHQARQDPTAWDFDSEWIRMIPNLQIWYHMESIWFIRFIRGHEGIECKWWETGQNWIVRVLLVFSCFFCLSHSYLIERRRVRCRHHLRAHLDGRKVRLTRS